MTMRRLAAGRVFLSPSLTPAAADAAAAAVLAAQPNLKVVRHPRNVPLPHEDTPADATAMSFTQAWLAQRGHEFNPASPLPKALEHKFECLVTADRADADGAFALHCRRIPVLLVPTAPATGHACSFAGTAGHPLLTVAEPGQDIGAAVTEFLRFPATPGRVFVIEGGDGAGKQTQVARLVARLQQEGYPVATYDYPHDAARYGLLIREALGGHRGDLKAVSPLVFAAVYGLNREDHQPTLAYWLLRGTNVVLDRYMTANFGHQASKLQSDDERLKAINGIAAFEQDWLDLPAPHRVAYLNLPPEFALRAMQQDATRKALDAHEKAGIEYKNNVRRAFLWCCGNLPGWAEVPCVDADEKERLSRDTVHDAVWSTFAPEFVNKQQKSD